MLKKELELEERVNLLEKEVNLLGEASEKTRLDMEETVDSLRLDIESVKMVLKDLVPDFQDKFRNIKNTVLREIDPQWIAKHDPES
jgi:hypothetical protein